MIHIIKYLRNEELADETLAFYFEKPENFNYRSGQFGEFALINPVETDGKGNSRMFSLASAPDEKHLLITTRLRDSAFKRVLKNSLPGTELILEAPLGVFTLPSNQLRPLIFLAGGIGITPFRSMIVDVENNNSSQPILLFYSNRRLQDAAHFTELEAIAKNNSNFKFVPIITGTSDENNIWKGETGHITTELLNKHTSNLKDPIYYVAGPEKMVQSVRKLLIDNGVNKNDIKVEEFSGY